MSEHLAMEQDYREARARIHELEAELTVMRGRAYSFEDELAALRSSIRAVIGTAGAEGQMVGDAGDWLTVVRVYAEALEAIGVLVEAEPVDTGSKA